MRVFVSYSPHDEQRKRELLQHLAPAIRAGRLSPWDKSQLVPGDEQPVVIEAELARAEVALVLLSAAYLDTGGPADRELVPIMTRRRDGLRVVPIVLAACDWQSEPRLKDLQVLPRDGLPLDGRAEVLVEVSREIAALSVATAILPAAAPGGTPVLPGESRGRLLLRRMALPLTLIGLALLLVVRFLPWPPREAATKPVKDAEVSAAVTPTPPAAAVPKAPNAVPVAASTKPAAASTTPAAASTARAAASTAPPRRAPAAINSDNQITRSRGAKLRNHATVPAHLGPARINSGNRIADSEGAQLDNSVTVTP